MKEDNYYENSRDDIVALIPLDAKRVMDVGCGFGAMGARLKRDRKVEVIGVESEAKAIDIARGNVDELIVGDVERLSLPFDEGYFDCIVYGDLLEHLKDPWSLLKSQSRYLKKGGHCIVSVPNISHYKILQDLLKDKWEYKSSGIMDRSHLRFFTLKGILATLEDCGYAVTQIQRRVRASAAKKLINSLLLGRITHLLVEQYVIKARLD